MLNAFRKAFADIYCLSFEPALPEKLAVSFSALKSVCCHKTNKRNGEVCPVCVDNSVEVAGRIPMLTKEGSSPNCRVNGSVMDHENYPMMLPSKHIYSISALRASETSEEYYCAITDTSYKKTEARKVFLA